MNKKLKVLASALTVLMVASTLVGCGSSSSSDSSKKSGQTLTIWSQYKGTDLVPVKKVAEEWAKSTGNKVVIKEDSNMDSLQAAVKSSKGPDIELGVPQDHIGSFVKAGIAAEVPSSAFSKSDYLDSAANAVTYQGKNWGIPCVVKTYALFYNTDMVTTPPTTWEDLIAQGKEKGLKWDPTDFYFNYAVLAGNGAYVFKVDKKGNPDTSKNGLGGPEAVKGFTEIKKLVDDKILTASDTGDVPKGLFTQKKIAFLISGTWATGDINKSGVKYAVVPYPKINGKAAPTFASIDVNVVSSASKNKDLAFQFLKDTSSKMEKALYDVNFSIPALKSLADSKEVQSNKVTAAFIEQAKSAEVMGNYPEFGQIWVPGANHLKSVVAGKETPEAAAKALSSEVQQAVEAMK